MARQSPIRPEQPSDHTAIHALLESCFPTDAEARLVDALRASNRLLVSLVAIGGGDVVGHIAFSPVVGSDGSAGLGLAPVAVAESRRRGGVGAALIERGLEECRRIGCGWVVVLGEPGYYSRFGFGPAPSHGLSDEYGGGDAFQIVRLRQDQPMPGPGLVRYAPEFGLLG